MIQAARESADQFLRTAKLPAYYDKPIFLRTEDRGDEIWVVYKKTFLDERIQNPAELVVAYDKKTGVSRAVPLE